MSDPNRPRISGSMALKCRMHIYLAAHGYPEEPTQPGAQRTFDLGHIIEAAMFRPVPLVSVDDDGGITEQIVGPWWKDLGEVRDPVTGKSFTASMDQLSGFQRVVSFAGYKGHVDALAKLDTGLYVPDVKSTQGFGFDRHLKSVLLEDVFAREYVGQLHFYMAGLREEGEDIAGAFLLFYNKENSQVMARFVDYDPLVVEEILERLSWAKNDAEPEPDHVWTRGEKLPLRCTYCSFREACAGVRGLALSQSFVKGKPVWVAA